MREILVRLPDHIAGALACEASQTDTQPGSGVQFARHAFIAHLLELRYAEGGEGHRWLQQHIGEERAKAQAVKEFREKLKGLPTGSCRAESD